MSLVEKLSFLASRGESFPVTRWKKFLWLIPYRSRGGWISIEVKDDKDVFFVMWTDSKDSHLPHISGSAYAVDIRRDTGELNNRFGQTGAWKSAISMWPIYDDNRAEAERIFGVMKYRIDVAYAWQKALVDNENAP